VDRLFNRPSPRPVTRPNGLNHQEIIDQDRPPGQLAPAQAAWQPSSQRTGHAHACVNHLAPKRVTAFPLNRGAKQWLRNLVSVLQVVPLATGSIFCQAEVRCTGRSSRRRGFYGPR
jgi:hypothetical protein